MARPKNMRRVRELPRTDYFKPRGVPMRQLEEIALAIDEFEALRLADYEGLDQEQAAAEMHVSRPTFARIVRAARSKVADALVNGKVLRIEGGTFELSQRAFACRRCGHRWGAPFGSGGPEECPSCRGRAFERLDTRCGRGRHRL